MHALQCVPAMKSHLFVLASANELPLSGRCLDTRGYLVPRRRLGSCQGETSHMFDYSDEELSALVVWLSRARKGV